MSFGANAIGFFLDIDASRMRSELANAKKEYTSFVDSIEKLNKKAVSSIEKGIADIALATRKQSRSATGMSGGGKFGGDAGLVRELTKVLTAALSHAQLRLQPQRPMRKNPIFDQSQPLIQTYRRMPQPPDFVGGFKIQRFAEAERRGPVRAHPGMRQSGMSSRIGDNIIIRANEGEVLSKQETYEDLVAELQKKRGNDDRNNDRIRKLLERNADVVEALTRVRQAQNLGGVAAQYGKYGIGVGNIGELHSSMKSGREGLRAALAGMTQEDFRAMTEVIEDMDDNYASMEKHLEGMAKSSSTIRKNTEATATGGGRRGPFSSNMDFPLRYMALSQSMRDLRGIGYGAQTVLGGMPVTQEQFARSYAQLGGSMQSGRETFSGAYSITGSSVGGDTLAGAMYSAAQHGFRGKAASRIGAAAAMAQQGGGLDPSAMLDVAASMRRFGYSTGAQQSVIGGMLGNQQAVGANGTLLSSIISGADIAGMISTRGPRNAANIATGMSGLAAGLLTAGGNDDRAAGAAGALMQAITGYGKGDTSQLSRLAGGFQLDQGSLDRFLKTGDISNISNASAGFARSMLEQNPMVRTAYAEMAGMDVGSYTDALRALADLPVTKLKSTVEGAAQAMSRLAKASNNATNFADRFGNALDRIGSAVGASSGGMWNSMIETPWERVHGALGTAKMGMDLVGSIGGMLLPAAAMGSMRGMRRGAGRALAGAGGMLGRGFGWARGAAGRGTGWAGSRIAAAAGGGAGVLGGMTAWTYGRQAVGGAMGRMAGAGMLAGALRGPGMLAGAGGALRTAGGFAGSALRIGGAIASAPLMLGVATTPGGWINEMFQNRPKPVDYDKTLLEFQQAAPGSQEQWLAAARLAPLQRAREQGAWESISGEDGALSKVGVTSASLSKYASILSATDAASSGGGPSMQQTNTGGIMQILALSKAGGADDKTLTSIATSLKNSKASTIGGLIDELDRTNPTLTQFVDAGASAVNASDALSDDAETRDKAGNKLLMQIRDTLTSILGQQRGMGAPVFAGVGQE